MIFDRTASDVEIAIAIRNQKVQTGKSLSESEVASLERGMLTINTINRVEEKEKELFDQIVSRLYLNGKIETQTWNYGEIFYFEDLERIVKNLKELKNMYFVYKTTPKTPVASYKYTAINDIEKILYDIEKYINNMISNYRYCGEAICGD